MKIYMKLTKKEVRRICLTNSFWDFRKKGILLIVVLILSILAAISVVLLNPADFLFALAIVVLVVVTVARFAGTRILKTLRAVIVYWRKKANNGPDYIETGDDGISCFSNNFLSFYAWSTILDVYETKNFYFIVTSKESRFAVPRRCFADQKQLDEFVTLLRNKIEKKLLHLKNYPIGIAAPDLMEQIIPTPPGIKEEILEKPEVGDELFSLRFTPRTKEFYGFLFWEYFTSKTGSEMTIAGLLLSAAFIVGVLNGSVRQGDSMSIVIFSVFLIAGLFLLLLVPIQIVFKIIKGIGKNATHSSEISYRFYKESYLLETTPGNTSLRIYWKELVEIKESPTAYYLFQTKEALHIIPKSAFASDKDKKDKMKALLRVAKSQMQKDNQKAAGMH